jgi:hypothetical protein
LIERDLLNAEIRRSFYYYGRYHVYHQSPLGPETEPVYRLFFAIWSVRATVLHAIDESIAPDGLRTVYSVTVKLILWALPAFGYVCWVRRAPPFRYLGISVMPSARKWLKLLVVIGLFLSAQVAFQSIVGE